MSTSQSALELERDFLARLLELTYHEDPQALLDEALQLVLRASGARHGYVEIGRPDGAHAAYFAASTAALDAKQVRGLLSSTIMRTALAEGRSIETRAAHADPRFADAPSVRGKRIDAVVCVPIGSRPLEGVLYLQGTEDGAAFTPDVVRLCEIFARHLAYVAPALCRKVSQAAADPTARWRDKLVGADAIVGASPALATVLKAAASAAPRDIGVLITGPSGSGKTALAEVIAKSGPRAKGPFVALNCANLDSNLVESELFGAMPGSHSTATRRILGKVEVADHGTLFLDEIAELSASAQAKLLQVLQDGTFYPLGAARPQQADVRIMAATNTNLLERVRQGGFREDLYYRLCVIEIAMPSLEARRVDIAALAERFLQDAVARLGLPALRLSERALRALETADWPGNVRQLKNTIDAAAVRALADETTTIEASHVFPNGKEPDGRSTFHAIMRHHQRQVLIETLARHQWNVADAATALGLGRSSVYQLIKTLGIEKA